LYVGWPATCWLSLGGTVGIVSSPLSCLHLPTVLRIFRIGFILSCLVASSKFLRSFSLAARRHVLPGFLSSSRLLRRCPLGARLSTVSRYVPSSGFRNLSTVYSTLRIGGFVSPHCHVQDSLPFRDFSCAKAGSTRRRSVPPCRFPPFAHRQAGCHSGRPRLRGLDPWSNAFLSVGV